MILGDQNGRNVDRTLFLPLTNLLEVMDMPVHVNINGEGSTLYAHYLTFCLDSKFIYEE